MSVPPIPLSGLDAPRFVCLPAAEYVGGGSWRVDPDSSFSAVRGKPVQMIDHLLCKDAVCSAYLEKICIRFTLNVRDVRQSSKQLYNKLSQVAHGVSGEVAIRGEYGSMELAALCTMLECAGVPYNFYGKDGLIVAPSPYKL